MDAFRSAVAGVGILAAGVGYNLPDVLPEPAFMHIRELSYADGLVTFDRAVMPPGAVAGWVVQVHETVTGARVCLGSGSDDYEVDEPRRRVWTLDQFAGDEGCLDRLTPGTEYMMFATWSPMDGQRPVAEQLRFTPDALPD
jgi:hypothetical protein